MEISNNTSGWLLVSRLHISQRPVGVIDKYQNVRILRSSAAQLHQPPTTSTTFDSRAFTVAAPSIWNSQLTL